MVLVVSGYDRNDYHGIRYTLYVNRECECGFGVCGFTAEAQRRKVLLSILGIGHWKFHVFVRRLAPQYLADS